MEEQGGIAECSAVEAEAHTCKSDSYLCHHYERDTCLIHFACCPEDTWYACHKCHNEALGLVDNLDEKGRENEEVSSDDTDDNYMRATNIPEEMEDSLNQVETSSETESTRDPLNKPSSGGQPVNRNKNVTGETSHWPSNTEEGSSEESSPVNHHTGLHDDPPTSEKVERNKTIAGVTSDAPMNEENASQLLLNTTSPSPKERKTNHSVATALDGTRLKCAKCETIQEFAQSCVQCANFSFATYFCGECKLLIEKKVDPYHCVDCGICRGNKADHFHCDVCNICMALSLKDNHKCFADRGHDPCAICFEEVFSGAVILPCHHMIHEDCAEKLVLSGSNLCPMCRSVILQEDEETVNVEERAQQTISFGNFFCMLKQKMCGGAKSLYKRCFTRPESSQREIEMANVTTPVTPQSEISYTTSA